MTSAEHRKHRRARVLLPVKVTLLDEPPIHAVATDLSVGGLFLLNNHRIAGAGEAEIEVELDPQHIVKVHARVVRRQRPDLRGLEVPGVGLAFEGLRSPEAKAIAAVVDSKAA